MLNIQDLLSLAQGKVVDSYDKAADSYDAGITRAIHSLGLQRKGENTTDIGVLAGLFSAGLVTGVALSLLFAPKSGSEMRRSVRRALPTRDYEDDDYDDYDLPRYDFEDDRFRRIRRPRRSHGGRF